MEVIITIKSGNFASSIDVKEVNEHSVLSALDMVRDTLTSKEFSNGLAHLHPYFRESE